jgi:hypothetical protein
LKFGFGIPHGRVASFMNLNLSRRISGNPISSALGSADRKIKSKAEKSINWIKKHASREVVALRPVAS